MHIISNIALISINETLAVQLISFLIFLFLINRIMFRRLKNVMAERDNHIGKIQRDTVAKENEFKNLTNQLKQDELAIKEEAFELKKELEGLGSQQATEIFVSVRKEIEALKEKTQQEVDAQITAARKNMVKESEALAVSVMERILDRRLV